MFVRTNANTRVIDRMNLIFFMIPLLLYDFIYVPKLDKIITRCIKSYFINDYYFFNYKYT